MQFNLFAFFRVQNLRCGKCKSVRINDANRLMLLMIMMLICNFDLTTLNCDQHTVAALISTGETLEMRKVLQRPQVLLGCCFSCTIFRMRQNGLSSRGRFSNVTDEQLDVIVHEIKRSDEHCG